MKYLLRVFVLFFAGYCPLLVFAEPARVALVIGNADYERGWLANPINDARAVTNALQKTGFKVTLVENANRQKMKEAVDAFGDELNAETVGLFYYSGHGVQFKGKNYLIPINGEKLKKTGIAGP